MANQEVRNYPLQWPLGWTRTKHPRSSPFQVSESTAIYDLFYELRRLGGRHIVLSSNARVRKDGMPYADEVGKAHADPGVAVYFELNGKSQVIACDTYERMRGNIRGVGLTIQAMRSIERYGSTSLMERAFQGFEALPPERPWWDVLGIALDQVHTWSHANRGEAWRDISSAYKSKAREAHPDIGGSLQEMQTVNTAYEKARQEWGPSI